mgnify:FL=1|jgi:hypothetical protein
MMKKLIIIGESHTRSFSYRENVLPFFMGNGKTINLSTKNITKIDSKIKNILSTIDKENSITFLFLGEPNCRYPLKKKWDPHWDEIRNKKTVKPLIDLEHMTECVENLSKLDLTNIDYILTPTGAYDPVIPALSKFNELLCNKFKDKVIDIFSSTIDKDLKVLDSYKAKNWEKDPIHVNSKISEDLLFILKNKQVIDNVDDYKSKIDGYFGTHLPSNFGTFDSNGKFNDSKITLSKFGSYIIKE